jgi:uncharacterized protein
MNAFKRLLGALVALAFGVALSGCASRLTEHFYTVSTAGAEPGTGAERQPIAVSPVVIPALIDRPQLVVRTAGHEVAVLENHRWAEPLSADLTRALIGDLRRTRPGLYVASADAPRGRMAPLILDVVIADLTGGPGPSASLQASWVLRDRSRTCARAGSLAAQIPMHSGDNAIPAAYADAMSRLADAIARTIPDGGSCAGD